MGLNYLLIDTNSQEADKNRMKQHPQLQENHSKSDKNEICETGQLQEHGNTSNANISILEEFDIDIDSIINAEIVNMSDERVLEIYKNLTESLENEYREYTLQEQQQQQQQQDQVQQQQQQQQQPQQQQQQLQLQQQQIDLIDLTELQEENKGDLSHEKFMQFWSIISSSVIEKLTEKIEDSVKRLQQQNNNILSELIKMNKHLESFLQLSITQQLQKQQKGKKRR
ncbi:serine/threonine-protein kinase pakD-like [Nasonia vitripennis]|uniref:Uncharacterized protein n=1 Tax=Nasonia vitripennis TaxID=7425 RepID=A0A7M7QIF2_NASVI|nr:serine/threonine-protein kinase pakD-like [Nasonia vitripennis]